MPEPAFLSLYSYTPEPPKKSPIIKLSCGIGDTDGFPAFDVDSEQYAAKDDSKWGFLITGGAEFHMPLTVFQVTPDGLADKGGICLGDILLEINEEDATQLTLSQAHEKIDASGKKIQFLVKSMDEEESIGGYEPGEERVIVLRVPKPAPPPKEFVPTPLLGSRCWHPIMWTEPPPPPKPKKKKTKTEIDEEGNEVIIELSEDESSEEEEEELPHHRIVRNIRRFFAEVRDNELKARITEDMLMILPSAPKASTIEKRLHELQRKLSEIAEIPKILSSTLATVSQTFDKLTTASPPLTHPSNCCRHYQSGNDNCADFYDIEQKRKLSYDEDVYDYELSDDMSKEEFDVKEAYLQLKRYAARQRKSKDVTPESDYASESNYPQKESKTKGQDDLADGNVDYDENNDIVDDDYNENDDVEDDGSEKSCDMYEEFNLSVLKTPSGQVDNESDIEEFDDDCAQEKVNDDDDEEDFLTTTFTWNLRNKPKLQIIDTEDDDDGDNDDDDESVNLLKGDNDQLNDEGEDKFDVVQQKSFNKSKENSCENLHIKADTPEKDQKMDKLERFWPWADREKIIYKQSTCHLVPHKPLGLIEQRIKLLAKRNLLEHINKIKNPQ